MDKSRPGAAPAIAPAPIAGQTIVADKEAPPPIYPPRKLPHLPALAEEDQWAFQTKHDIIDRCHASPFFMDNSTDKGILGLESYVELLTKPQTQPLSQYINREVWSYLPALLTSNKIVRGERKVVKKRLSEGGAQDRLAALLQDEYKNMKKAATDADKEKKEGQDGDGEDVEVEEVEEDEIFGENDYTETYFDAGDDAEDYQEREENEEAVF